MSPIHTKVCENQGRNNGIWNIIMSGDRKGKERRSGNARLSRPPVAKRHAWRLAGNDWNETSSSDPFHHVSSSLHRPGVAVVQVRHRQASCWGAEGILQARRERRLPSPPPGSTAGEGHKKRKDIDRDLRIRNGGGGVGTRSQTTPNLRTELLACWAGR